MSDNVFPFSSRLRLGAPVKSTTDMALPLQRREPTIGELYAKMKKGAAPNRKRRLGNVAMRKARDSLVDDAGGLESCFQWMLQIVERDHDPRGLAAFLDEYEEWAVFKNDGDVDRLLGFLETVLAERRKRFPLPKPRLV